jgi:lipopolysaccharide export system permease protein
MRLLSRYLLRQLAAPFMFALVALTSLMLLSQIAKKFGSLVGKGLPWTVIAEVFGLSVPFIVAMTLPMAVLVAVLYAFSHLAADNEITAMRASGVSVYQVLAPVLLWGAAMSIFNFVFVDQVLPRSNARLRTLLIDIGRKKPTFELREQVINEVPPSQYFLRASRIDAATGHLRGVTIYDVGGETSRRIIYADSGLMAYAEGQIDLSLRLFDGTIHQYRPSQPETFQLTYFRINDIRVKNVFDELQRNSGEAVRGDREMSTCEMLSVIHEADDEEVEAQQDRARLASDDLRKLLALPRLPPHATEPPPRPLPAYCDVIDKVQTLVLPKTAEAQGPAQVQDTVRRGVRPGGSASRGGGRNGANGGARPRTPAGADSLRKAPGGAAPRRIAPAVRSTPAKPIKPVPPPTRPFQANPNPRLQLSNWSQVATAIDRAQDADRRGDRYEVEVHKKWAISMACISFVIIGIVLALRFPRGGIGLVIGGGLAVFSIYYVGLTAGESLADRGIMAPWAAMWWPNIVLTIIGVIGLIRVSKESGSTRGGDFQELVEAIRHLVRWRRVIAPRRRA